MATDSPFEIGVRRRVAGDHYDDWIDQQTAVATPKTAHRLDDEKSRKLHRKLLDWFFFERTKQADNRLQMATDADFYDGDQWDSEDAAILKERRQVPLVYNEVAPMVDWIIGTERRTRVDWSVLPRAEDDVESADVKTKTLKYVSDLNRVPFVRSQAFAEAVKVGLGWVDDGARDDPTKDVLYSRYESWRNVLYDSASYDLDLGDARYLFRWRWVDEDVALMMFPDRADKIRKAVIDAGTDLDGQIDDEWYLGNQINQSGSMYATTAGVYGEASRRKIRLIECQFRMPETVKVIMDGPMKGSIYNDADQAMAYHLGQNPVTIIDRVIMRVHFAVMTETDFLALSPSVYRHNAFTLTPIWCYRRGKDRMPYGVIRRVRDIQQDLNKRASKALFLLSTNQVIADKNAVEDKEIARSEADMPDGWIEKAQGKELIIRRDTDAATGQLQMMTLDAQAIQKSASVNNENLGRQTNAISGEAIKARQNQGAVGTTELFDNHRMAIQVQGEKQLSNIEQFYTEEKVVRLTGGRNSIDWLKINQPEIQPDGSVRFLNDITASMADFKVAEQDYSETMREVMFEGLSNMAQRLPPEVAMRLYITAMEFSNMPNKDEVADEMRAAIGLRNPNKPMTPEEAQQAEQQMAVQSEAMQMQREQTQLALAEQRAKVEKINAEAIEIRSRAENSGGLTPEYEQALRRVQEQAASRLEAMSEQLRKVQMDAANRTMQINKDADVKLEAARIQANSNERIAEINQAGNAAVEALMGRLDKLNSSIQEVSKQVNEANSAAEQAAKAAEQVGKSAEDAVKKADEAGKIADEAVKAVEMSAKKTAEKPEPAVPAAPPSITVPITIESGAFQVDARPAGGNKTITLTSGEQKVTGTITQEGEDPKKGTKSDS